MMTQKEVREMVEDVANLTALQIVRPIEIRLASLETKICCKEGSKKESLELKWKIIGFLLAIPGGIAAVLAAIQRM